MRRFANLLVQASILSVLVPSASAGNQPMVQSITSLNHRDATVVSKSPDRVVLAAGDMPHGVELLVGRRAVEYLRAIQAQHPDRFERMGHHLSDRGYVPTREVTVARLVRFLPAEGKPHVSDPTFRLAYSASTSEGVVITQSWDDGSDATWEGSVYVQRYSDGAWTSSEGQLDISTGNWEAIWAEAVAGEKPGGGDPLPASLDGGISARQQFSLAKVLPSTSLHDDYRLCMYPYVMLPWWQDWANCVVAGAAGCGTACALTGPGWPKCTGACTAGVYVACAVQMLLK